MAEIHWYIIMSAFILDFVLGDPEKMPHPVIYMGKAVDFFENKFRKLPASLFVSGLIFALFLIFSSWAISLALVKICYGISTALGNLVQTVLIFYCLSSKSLETSAAKVADALEENDIDRARKNVSMIVGRQTDRLDETGVTRASIETVAENLVDGCLSPLFYALIGGAPLAVAYKMVNTLDSMVGYKNGKYVLFGRAAARIDDIANFIPARISVPLIALSVSFLSSPERGILALKTGFSEGKLHKSPNSGYPEAAFAGALKTRLGGPNYYHGSLIEKPFIGKKFNNPEKEKIKKACDLMLLSSFTAIFFSCSVLFLKT